MYCVVHCIYVFSDARCTQNLASTLNLYIPVWYKYCINGSTECLF